MPAIEATEKSVLKYEYFDRDLSWLSFNLRVLLEAKDSSVPLYERIKFMAIYSSNLDEFFRVRVASTRRIKAIKKKKLNQKLEVKPNKLLANIHREVGRQLEIYGEIWRDGIIPDLQRNNIHLYRDAKLLPAHKPEVEQYFKSKVLAFLQPKLLDQSNAEVPFLENKELYLAIELKKNGQNVEYALLNIPSSQQLSRFLVLSRLGETNYIVHLDDIIRANIELVFPDYDQITCYSIKLNRDAGLHIEDEYSGDLVEKIKKQLNKRNVGVPSRFLYDQNISPDLLKLLKEIFDLSMDDLVPGGRYHNMNDLFGFPNPLKPKLEQVKPKTLACPELDEEAFLMNAMEKKDIVFHFPYQSYDYVLRFFNEAAIDPLVKEIKVTLYRIAANSVIANALISAARNGKQVIVFVELKARFDEANNIFWAQRMEEAGVIIIYSMPGLKVHAKVALVTREDNTGNKKGYAFFGTGNFNESTANIYADHGLLTCHAGMTKELDKVFKYLYKKKPIESLSHLLVPNHNMQEDFLALIQGEIENAKAGKKTGITIKLNNLEDKIMIDKLYEASTAGVKVELLIRGICCLIPQVKGQSENISVTRVVDIFLEHARIFIFENGGNEVMYLSSADWMKRNLYRRVEVGFPIYDASIRSEIKGIIDLQLKDNQKACLLDENHNNISKRNDGKEVRCQIDTYEFLGKNEK